MIHYLNKIKKACENIEFLNLKMSREEPECCSCQAPFEKQIRRGVNKLKKVMGEYNTQYVNGDKAKRD